MSFFLRFPREIHDKIYGFACEETINIHPEWSSREMPINPGRNLLLVSRQIHEEAKTILYRTLILNSCESPQYLSVVESSPNRLEHTRCVEIHFTCFCTLTDDYEWDHRLPDYRKFAFWRIQWSSVLAVVMELAKVDDLSVTLDTCCRKKLNIPQGTMGLFLRARIRDPDTLVYRQMDQWELFPLMGTRGYCVALETLFLRLLPDSTRVGKMTLRGDVPPSFLFRLFVYRDSDGVEILFRG